jgi:orotidine-5'-phosphate decarboxylase
MGSIINLKRSVIPACDVSTDKELERLIEETHDIPGIGGYKIGLQLTIVYGLKNLISIARKHTDLPIIYDHQKAGNDIPELGKNFSSACRTAGVNAVILFPFAGSLTERQWIKACQDEGLGVIVGGHMTQREFLRSENGFISDDSPKRIYEIAGSSGVTDFVVPGNKPEYVNEYRKLFQTMGLSFTLYAPGFLTQGGEISECGKVAGDQWHAIVGSGIYKASNIKDAAKNFVRQLLP